MLGMRLMQALLQLLLRLEHPRLGAQGSHGRREGHCYRGACSWVSSWASSRWLGGLRGSCAVAAAAAVAVSVGGVGLTLQGLGGLKRGGGEVVGGRLVWLLAASARGWPAFRATAEARLRVRARLVGVGVCGVGWGGRAGGRGGWGWLGGRSLCEGRGVRGMSERKHNSSRELSV